MSKDILKVSKEIKKEAKEQLARIKRGCSEIIPEKELLSKIEKSLVNKKPLRVKFGADPSRPDLHLGHAVVLQKLKVFQDLGHHIFFLIGDFTAQIGDPTGKNETRPTLSKDEVKRNAQSYAEQVFKILNRNTTQVVFNSQWTDTLKINDIIKLASQVTVAQILERDDFSKRYKGGQPISVHEFLYPIAQAYDSVQLHADVELGGTDQKFNLLLGRDFQKNAGQSPQAVVMTPLLVGLDGSQKMSKSLNNAISFEDKANDFFGKIMSISDDSMYHYYELLTEEDLKVTKELHPKEAKMQLATILIERFFDKDNAQKARAEFEAVFSKKALPKDIPLVTTAHAQIALTKAMSEHKLCPSLSEARRLIVQGAVQVNNKKITDTTHTITDLKEAIIKVGKRRYLKIKFNVQG